MTEVKLGQPSIQNLQIKPQPNTTLTQNDIDRLFRGTTLPKFDLIDVKLQTAFCKRQKAHYFLSMLERWNKRSQQNQKLSINIRTQFQLMEFIQSSLKRICLMTDNQIDVQLDMLYKWFTKQTKGNPAYVVPTMPQKPYQNQQYNVSKTFKTNPTLLIKQYLRPRFMLGSPTKENVEQLQQDAQLLRKKLMVKPKKQLHVDNFLTELDMKHQNFTKNSNANKEKDALKCLLLRREDFKIRNEQIRRCVEKSQIEKNQWKFKLNKGRLMSHNVKSYLQDKANRTTKSSEGKRNKLQKEVIYNIKKMRIQTSYGKRVPLNNEYEREYPALTEINNFGLLSNPFEVRLKKKKKVKNNK